MTGSVKLVKELFDLVKIPDSDLEVMERLHQALAGESCSLSPRGAVSWQTLDMQALGSNY